jgi:hypothetical protein
MSSGDLRWEPIKVPFGAAASAIWIKNVIFFKERAYVA